MELQLTGCTRFRAVLDVYLLSQSWGVGPAPSPLSCGGLWPDGPMAFVLNVHHYFSHGAGGDPAVGSGLGVYVEEHFSTPSSQESPGHKEQAWAEKGQNVPLQIGVEPVPWGN